LRFLGSCGSVLGEPTFEVSNHRKLSPPHTDSYDLVITHCLRQDLPEELRVGDTAVDSVEAADAADAPEGLAGTFLIFAPEGLAGVMFLSDLELHSLQSTPI